MMNVARQHFSFFLKKKNVSKKVKTRVTHSLMNIDAETLTVECLTRARIACGNHLMSLL